MTEKTTNHMKAPKSASFVANLRQVFGADQVTVLYVKENNVQLGEPVDMAADFYSILAERKAAA
jgi:hypothetical protein